jgi:hypothetical protein
MASSSSNADSRKNKRPRDDSIPPTPEKYKIFDIPQDILDKCHSGAYGTEKTLIDLYNNRIKFDEKQIKRDEEIIQERQKMIEERNTTIAEIRKQIVDVYKRIADNFFIS